MSRFKKIIRWSLILVVVTFVAIQFVPVAHTNPTVQSPIQAPADVAAVLKKGCYDCHSHETNWPWYSHVAPVSWQIVEEVDEGRSELNFSNWGDYSPKKQAHKISEIWEEVESNEMPPAKYLWLHSEAKLSDADRQVLRSWARSHGDSETSDEH
ncbi:MAG: heme-binding domain-containing protein [Planctomycetes bacterium]|nr:heme-binding domain-containing protein [Planctomycetota bacterium]